MSTPVTTLSPSDAQSDAIQLMQSRNSFHRSCGRRWPTCPPAADKLVTRETIESELAGRLDVTPRRAGELLSGVANTIADSVSPGQMEDVQGQLPRKLRTIFTAAQSN